MFLKNYTSNTPSHLTIARIEQVLIRCGVNAIQKEYLQSGEISAVIFRIETGEHRHHIRLPVDKAAVLEALWGDYIAGVKKPRKQKDEFKDQAERTAWKLMQDWVEVQLSLIQMRQADFIQVFMPYVWDGKRTFYQALKESNYKALLPERN